MKRATGTGYWRGSGPDEPVRHLSETVGMKKRFIFYSGKAPVGERTNWVMHEYRLLDEELQRAGEAQKSFVLCRIFEKSGNKSSNGGRYAPFNEEDWGDDAALVIPGVAVNDDIAKRFDMRAKKTVTFQNPPISKVFICQNEPPISSQMLPFDGKRKRSEDNTADCEPQPESSSFRNDKRSKQYDPNSTQPSQSLPSPIPPTSEAAAFENLVPPEDLLSNLRNQIVNVTMEKELLRIKLMRAQAVINSLLSKSSD